MGWGFTDLDLTVRDLADGLDILGQGLGANGDGSEDCGGGEAHLGRLLGGLDEDEGDDNLGCGRAASDDRESSVSEGLRAWSSFPCRERVQVGQQRGRT